MTSGIERHAAAGNPRRRPVEQEMLDVGDDPDRDAGAVRPAQQRPVDDRRIVEAAMRARHGWSGGARPALRATFAPLRPDERAGFGLARHVVLRAWSDVHANIATTAMREGEAAGVCIMAQIVGGFGVPAHPDLSAFRQARRPGLRDRQAVRRAEGASLRRRGRTSS